MAVQASRSRLKRRLILSAMTRASSRLSAMSAVGTWPAKPSMTMWICYTSVSTSYEGTKQ